MLAALATLAASVPRPLAAQAGTFLERLNLDRLQLTALGAGAGVVRPAQLETTEVYELHSDYGTIAGNWNVAFTTSFWQTRYQSSVVAAFARQIEQSTNPPSIVVPSEVTVSDIALGAEGRWRPRPTSFLRPYLGIGMAAHVINTEGELIDGTFIENALDYITGGVSGSAGVDVQLFEHFTVGGQARYDLLSGIRFGSARLTATYIFDSRPRRPASPAPAPEAGQ
jgi:outer membrane protein W